MASQAFVDSVVKEIIQPGVDRLMEVPYFTELRSGKLSPKRLQGWALQHYCIMSRYSRASRCAWSRTAMILICSNIFSIR